MSETTPLAADLTLQEVAAIKRCSLKSIRRRVADGTLPAYRLGPRLIRVKPEDLDRLDRRIPTAGFAAR